jgi:hypothetical protein
MRGQGLRGIAALDRLAPRNATRIWQRLATNKVVVASDKTRVIPTIQARSGAQVGLLLYNGRTLMCSEGVKRIRLVLSTLGTVQDASTDSSSAWPSTNSNRAIVRTGVGVSANLRHVICFSRRRELNRILVIGVGVSITANVMMTRAISVVVKAGVARGGGGFGGGKCDILVEPLRTPTADYRSYDKNQHRESNEPYNGKGASDSSGVFKETLAGVGVHNASGSGSGSDNSGDEYCATIGDGKVC